jgi:hypothetical protein
MEAINSFGTLVIQLHKKYLVILAGFSAGGQRIDEIKYLFGTTLV